MRKKAAGPAVPGHRKFRRPGKNAADTINDRFVAAE